MIPDTERQCAPHGNNYALIEVFAQCIEAEHLDGARMSQLAHRPVAEGSRELAELAAPYLATSVALSEVPSLQTHLRPMAALILDRWRNDFAQ